MPDNLLMRILLTGGTGFLGRALVHRLTDYELVLLTREPELVTGLPDSVTLYPWSPLEGPPDAAVFEGVDAVIHLAGENVAGRWTTAKKKAIRDSRVLGTRSLVRGLAVANPRPPKLISASAIGFYGEGGSAELDEASESGHDFLAEVSRSWEREAKRAEDLGITVALLRTGIVLHPGGGALKSMFLPTRLGLGGPLGSGEQWWSWIHLDDWIGAVLWLLENELEGPFNLTAPGAVPQGSFASTLGRTLHRPSFLPTPSFALRWVLGGFAVELLSSKKVQPRRLLDEGFRFRFPNLEEALCDLFPG